MRNIQLAICSFCVLSAAVVLVVGQTNGTNSVTVAAAQKDGINGKKSANTSALANGTDSTSVAAVLKDGVNGKKLADITSGSTNRTDSTSVVVGQKDGINGKSGLTADLEGWTLILPAECYRCPRHSSCYKKKGHQPEDLYSCLCEADREFVTAGQTCRVVALADASAAEARNGSGEDDRMMTMMTHGDEEGEEMGEGAGRGGLGRVDSEDVVPLKLRVVYEPAPREEINGNGEIAVDLKRWVDVSTLCGTCPQYAACYKRIGEEEYFCVCKVSRHYINVDGKCDPDVME